MQSVELIGANSTGSHVNLMPIFSAFMEMGVLPELVHTYDMMALFMVLAGIALEEKYKISVPARRSISQAP